MGRGIIESGLFRTERLGLEVRTTDPAVTAEGEGWIRSDIAPDTDQIATLRFDNGASNIDIPIYNTAASADSQIGKARRVRVGGVTGFIPIIQNGGAYNQLRIQHNGAWWGAHDSLSAIPDSGVSRWEFENGFTDSWGDVSGTVNGATFTSDAAVGDFALSFDGTDDYATTDTAPQGDFNTISFWFKPAKSFSGGESYEIPVSLTGTTGYYVVLGDVTSSISGETCAILSASKDRLNYTTRNFNANTWYFATFRRNDAGDGYDIFINAVNETDGEDANGGAEQWGNNKVTFGTRGDESDGPFEGIVDDPRIYYKALSDTEIDNLYNTGSING